ncbi:uncharacterized protein HKW66_Vig0230090 [Vigna angularis]|uniref:Uncharacterized protein n=1 Tax=Phaseolus angularis TaxID=3914 RepID=A0A8T0KAU4_PHAAN|nr:uncharacterized protein HKW66_Vig0230090 [Vigna angularis]
MGFEPFGVSWYFFLNYIMLLVIVLLDTSIVVKVLVRHEAVIFGSRQPNKFPITVSKKITGTAGGATFLVETLYDHIYGDTTRFTGGHSLSPRFEDYGQIFSNFHAPSVFRCWIFRRSTTAMSSSTSESSCATTQKFFEALTVCDFNISVEDFGGNGSENCLL